MPATYWSPSPSSTPEHEPRDPVRPDHRGSRARLRLHQRFSRQRQLHCNRRLHPGPQSRRCGDLGGILQFHGGFVVGTAVAKTIGKGLIDPHVVDPSLVFGALLGAIIWDLITWY